MFATLLSHHFASVRPLALVAAWARPLRRALRLQVYSRRLGRALEVLLEFAEPHGLRTIDHFDWHPSRCVPLPMPERERGPRRHAAARAWAFVATLVGGLVRSRTIDLAAEMGFWLFLSLVPLAAVASFVGARFAKEHTFVLETWLSALPLEARSFVTSQVAHVAAWRGGIAPAAAVTFVWLASNGVHSVLEAIEVQTGAYRPWWRKRLLSIAVCLALSIGGALLALLAVGLARVETAAGYSWPNALATIEWSGLGRAIRSALALTLAMGMTAGLYRVAIPRGARAHAKVLPGAAVAVALQVVLGWCYALYISRFGSGAAQSGGAYQAGLAAVGVTMTALWLLSIALLVGVELNAVLGRSLSPRANGPVAASGQHPNSRHDDERGDRDRR